MSLEKNVLGFVGTCYVLGGLVLGAFKELSPPVLLIVAGLLTCFYAAYREEERRK